MIKNTDKIQEKSVRGISPEERRCIICGAAATTGAVNGKLVCMDCAKMAAEMKLN